MPDQEPVINITLTAHVNPKRGDTIVVCTSESLSREILMEMRGKMMEYFEPMGVKVFIIAADDVFVLSPQPR